MKKIYFTVTNDLSYDQRMHRICTTLSENGFEVVLVGRELKTSAPLKQMPYQQVRLRCLFHTGSLFYAEYNLRLFFYLLSKSMHGICAIDLDTILPCMGISRIKRIPGIYDAHEYFTELKEVRTRPFVKRVWTFIERLAVPKFSYGYTVSQGLADAFQKKYGVQYQVIRNLPVLKNEMPEPAQEKFLVYQGAVNEARGFEYLIPAMKTVDFPLVVCGDGNFMVKLKKLIDENEVKDQVILKGMMLPEDLRRVALTATLGIGIAEKEGLNQFMALPNKFLEYIHAGLPQIAMAFPEYQKINQQFEIAVLTESLEPAYLAELINATMNDEDLLLKLRGNALKAREVFCWQYEEKLLIDFYRNIFNP